MKKLSTPSSYNVIQEAKLRVASFEKEFVIIGYKVSNSLSEIYRIKVTILCDKKISDDKLIDKKASLNLEYPYLKQTYNGYVDSMESYIIDSNNKNIANDKTIKVLFIVQDLNKLKHNVRSKVYDIGNPKNIIEEIFKSYNINIKIKVAISDRKIVCQYNENDYDFFCRLCNYYNIAYYYDFDENSLIIHNNESYTKNHNVTIRYAYVKKEFSNKSKITYVSREKWSTHTISGNYSPSKSNSSVKLFLRRI